LDPGFGYINTWFNFTLRYTNALNDPPVNLTLNFTQGTSHLGSWDLLPFELDPSDTNYTDGKWYYFNDTNFERGTNYTFHFAAKDPTGLWSTSETKDGPFVLNLEPRIITSNNPVAEEGELYLVDYEAEDLEDMNNLTWSVDTNASWLGMDPPSGNLTGTPPAGATGSYYVNVSVLDGYGGFDWTNFELIVGDTIRPIADAGSDGIVMEDDIYQFNGTNSSDNSGVLNYTWHFGDGGIGYGPTPVHIYKNSSHNVVALIVTDLSGNFDIDIINIIVLNQQPFADASGPYIGYEGSPITFNASGSFDTLSDINSLVYIWDFDNDTIYDDGVGKITTHIWSDEINITIGLRVIDDNGGEDLDYVNVVVQNVNPTVEILGNYSIEKGSHIILISEANDPGNDILEYRWDFENDGVFDTQWSPNDRMVNHQWSSEGNYTIKVEVRDGDGGLGSDTAPVEITKRKEPPVIGNIGNWFIRYNVSFPIDLSSYITDEDTPLSELEVTTSDPNHVSVSGLMIYLIYPQSMVNKDVDVEVFVADGTFISSEIFTVSISENYPPTLDGYIPDVEFMEDEEINSVFNLNDYFTDADGDAFEFEFIHNEPNLIIIIDDNGIVSFRTHSNWAGNVTVRFSAKDPSGAFTQDVIYVNVIPINDPPRIISDQIRGTTIEEGENWSIDLDDYFFDVETSNLTFTCSHSEIVIDPVTHVAVWIPNSKKELHDVVFTASDGEHVVSLDPVDLKVITSEPFPWALFILPFGLGLLVFAGYREIRYRYSIEEVFLVDNAGVLLVHLSKGESKAIDAKLVSGMLTAVQEFVKDSFMSNNNDMGDIKLDEGALGKLEYGDFKIVIERGQNTFLSAVIAGYDNKRLRKRLKDVVEEFETKYSTVLADWDGDMAKFDGAEVIVGRLLKSPSASKEISDDATSGLTGESDDMCEGVNVNAEELPSGDFGDVPSYYDDIDNGGTNDFNDTHHEHKVDMKPGKGDNMSSKQPDKKKIPPPPPKGD
jgi:hypothetical protein